MKKITVKLSELIQTLSTMKHDQMDFVELQIVPAVPFQQEQAPSFLHLQGIRKTADPYIVDYESIDEISGTDLHSHPLDLQQLTP